VKQGSILKVIKPFIMKTPGTRGKAVNAKLDEKFIVTSPMHMNIQTVKIDRLGKAHINIGYNFPMKNLPEYFSIVE